MPKKASQRNHTIDIFRYICAVFIVNIHSHPLLYINETANFIVVEHLSRFAVPFFFIVSGYYYSLRRYDGKKPFCAYMKKLFLVYTMWNVVYATELIVLRGGVSKELLLQILLLYCYNGVSQHLWFCLALMIAVCVLELACRWKGEKLLWALSLVFFAVGCFSDIYYGIGQYLPGLKQLYQLGGYLYIQRYVLYNISFVMMGNYIARHRHRLTAVSDKALSFALVGCLLATAGERLAATRLQWVHGGLFNFSLYPLMLVLFVLLLRHPAPRWKTAGAYLGATAAFMYYFHPIVLDAVNYHRDRPMCAFAIAVFVCTVIGFGLKKLNNKTVSYWLL